MPSNDPSAWTLSQRLDTGRGQIAWDSVGSGPPLVLVHGTPSRSVLWRNVAPLLAEQNTVYVFDLLGYGQSQRHVQQEVSIRVHGDVLSELVQTWGLDKPALVGHDIGGAAVLRAHLLHGTPARKIALVDAVVLRPWITATTRHLKAHLDVYATMPTHIFREISAAISAPPPHRRWHRRRLPPTSTSGRVHRGSSCGCAMFAASTSNTPPSSSHSSTP
ncbi:MAG: alpha/beta fold hydrolase [Geodermatophilaceae bacterium]